jgi:hypothetical protein
MVDIKLLVTSWPGEDFSKNPFDDDSSRVLGGAEIQVRLLCEALARSSSVMYANLAVSRGTGWCGRVSLASARWRSAEKGQLTAYGHLISRAVRSFRPDVVLSYLLYPCADYVFYRIRRTTSNRGPVLTAVDGSPEWQRVLDQGAQRELIPASVVGASLTLGDLFFARGENLRRALENLVAVPVVMLRPILDLQEPPMTAPRHGLWWIGRLAWPKRCDLALRAWEIMQHRASGPYPLHFNIVGSGTDRIRLERQVNDLPVRLREKVRFLGEVTHAEAVRCAAAASATIHLSEAEGFGSAPIESLALGTPTIVGGFPEVQREFKGHPRMFVADLEENAVADAISQSLRVGSGLREMKRFEAFSAESTAEIVLASITNCLGRRGDSFGRADGRRLL